MTQLHALQLKHDRCLEAKDSAPQKNETPAGSAKRTCRCSGICRICLCTEKSRGTAKAETHP